MKIMKLWMGSIERKLVISFLSLGIIPMILMGFLSYYNSSNNLLNQTYIQMKNLAEKAVEEIEAAITISKIQIDALILLSNTVAHYIEAGVPLDGGLKDHLTKELNEFQRMYPEIRKVRLFDNKGDERYSTQSSSAENAENEPVSLCFQNALNSKEVFFSDMFMSKELNEPILIVSKSFHRNDKVIGVLAMYVAGHHFTKSLEGIKLGKEGSTFLLNREGTIIGTSDKALLFKFNLNSSAFGKEIMQKKSGLIEYNYKGSVRISSFREYPMMQWIVVSSGSKNEILSSVYQVRSLFIILGIVMMGVAFVVAFFLSTQIAKPIQRVIRGLTGGAEQVASASSQVTSASHSLAEGTSEQAAGIEQTSSSLEQMSSMTMKNADNVQLTKAIMEEARQIIKKVETHMSQLAEAITEITRSSEETSKIIKTIDEIAFQTNLLALNAAVEAARAGEAGAGFAVVANEVRNLAMRASEAAKNTSHLIENTIKAVKKGNELTQSTQKAFEENVEIAIKHNKLIGEIAAASQEQVRGIEQINKTVAEMNKVVQKNAASAEESASASEEMNAQAEQMKGFVNNLVVLVGSKNRNDVICEKGLRHVNARGKT
jgi:methyl-accepting chemotaxis protein